MSKTPSSAVRPQMRALRVPCLPPSSQPPDGHIQPKHAMIRLFWLDIISYMQPKRTTLTGFWLHSLVIIKGVEFASRSPARSGRIQLSLAPIASEREDGHPMRNRRSPSERFRHYGRPGRVGAASCRRQDNHGSHGFHGCSPSVSSVVKFDWARPAPAPFSRGRTHSCSGPPHSTVSVRLSEWLLNSGAYMHWISAMPVWYAPLCWTRTEYSKTYTPLGR